MKKLALTFLTTSLLSSLLASTTVLACTDIKLTAKDGTIMIGRTMEFEMDLKSNLVSTPREKLITNTTPDGKPGLSWKGKYGYVFLDALNTGYGTDGMNEMGLSIEDLYLPGETQYQAIPIGKEKSAVSYLRFTDWVLGNFQTTDEVRAALPKIYVYAQTVSGMGSMIFPLHFAIHDATGKSIVVEFVGGKMNVYDHVTNVMTNVPQYPWQVTNLRNYLNLSPYNPEPIVANGVTYTATGQGSGATGLPGDYSPPSRFVKMAFLLKNAMPVNNAQEAVVLATHIINNVDIPIGAIRSKQTNGQDEAGDFTQWTVFKDLTHKVLYYHTYANPTLQSISLSKIDFSPNAPQLKMSIASAPIIADVTNQFLMQKSS